MTGEIEACKSEILKANEQNGKWKLRTTALEQDLRGQKEEWTTKLKVWIEKSDNDEKLIHVMKNELVKKGNVIGSHFEETTFNLNQEITKLRQEIKEKDKYINNITSLLLPDNPNGEARNNIDSETFSNLLNKWKAWEKENKALKNKSEEAWISDSWARENAKLRVRIKELEERLWSK